MALFDREFIACPDDKKDQIVFKHPDLNIRKYSRAIVNADQLALFVNKGIVIGEIGPGQHKLEADELPFLGAIIDNVVAQNMYRAELYYVSTREFVDEPFGGRIDDVQDPQTGMFVSLRVHGLYAMRVTRPDRVVTKLVGTVNVEENEAITDWVDTLLLKVMKVDVTRNITRNGWPIIGLSAYIPDIEESVVTAVNDELDSYGLALTRMGNFDISVSDDDMKTLKGFAKDTAYSRLAGSYLGAAQAQMMKGAGEGMAKGGGAGVQGAFIAAGVGLGAQMGVPANAPVAPPPPLQQGTICPSCRASNQPDAKFCANCGGSLAPKGVVCATCQAGNPEGAKFCANCGNSLSPPAAAQCAKCGTELAPDARFCANCGTGGGG